MPYSFRKALVYLLVYLQVFMPLDLSIRELGLILGPRSAHAAQPGSMQNPTCDKRCYDARTDNPAFTYYHSYTTPAQSHQFNIKKGINFALVLKTKADGYYIQGGQLNVQQVGNSIVVKFLHSDGNTYSITLSAKKNTWVYVSVSINPNFIAGTSRNLDTGDYDEKVYEFGYNPVDNDDPSQSYSISLSEGNLSQGLYWISFGAPFASGVQPFCSEQIAFCTYQWIDVTADTYPKIPNRKNFSIAWWEAGDTQGKATCDWFIQDTYYCRQNAGDLFQNTATTINDGARGLWGRRVQNINGVDVFTERYGIFQEATRYGVTQKFGMELDHVNMTWKKLGMKFAAGTISGNVGKIDISAPPALSPLSVTSDRASTWQSYSFSGKWFWQDTGVANVSTSCGGPGFRKAIDGCWEKFSRLCPVGQVNLYPSYDSCYTYTGNAGCFDGQTQFGDYCWLKQGTPSICPSDGYSYTLITPPSANYICKATVAPYCPYGTTNINGTCYYTSSTTACPIGQVKDGGYCYYMATPYCPTGQLVVGGWCKTAAECSSGYCFTYLGSANPACPADQIISYGGYCCSGYYDWSYGGACFSKQYSSTTCPDASNPLCFTSYNYACSSGYYWQATGQYVGKCLKQAGAACPYGYSYNSSLQLCTKYYGPACPSGYTYNYSTQMCERSVYASCPAGQSKYIDPNTGYYGCYTKDLSHGNPPGSIYCQTATDLQHNNRCYQYQRPICSGQYTNNRIVLGNQNTYGEWTGSCWYRNDARSSCPVGTFEGPGEFTTATHCLKPALQFQKGMWNGTLTDDQFASELCNAVTYSKNPANFKPCWNLPAQKGFGTDYESIYVGSGPDVNEQCPLDPSSECIQITDMVGMCGTSKPCASCVPDNISDNAYNYMEISMVKKLPNSDIWTGLFAYDYPFPNARDRVSLVGGRLPTTAEQAKIASVWLLGPNDYWQDTSIPWQCITYGEQDSRCLSVKRKVIVVWDDPNNMGFYAQCVYASSGDAICTGDSVNCQNGICPLNPALPCADWNGQQVCSQTQCQSLADPTAGEVEIVTLNESMYQNDGERDASGNCLGQLYVFAGKPSRCRPPGVTVGLLNNCCKSTDQVMTDSLGDSASVMTAIETIQTVYHIAQAAYYAEAIASGTASMPYAVDGTYYIIETGHAAAEISAEVAHAALEGANAATTAGASASQVAINTMLSTMVTTIIISAVVYVVMELLFGACDQGDIQTVIMRDSDYCHYIDDYCEKKWPVVGCVQKAKGYCCFNSKLGRIIHEQGRPQLQAFGPDGGWGTGETPNCRGFTPEEFQMLDFSKMDLSEYYQDIQQEMDQKLQDMQNTIDTRIQDYYNNVVQ